VHLAVEAMEKVRLEVSEAEVRVVHLDLSSLNSVKECASELNHSVEHIHLLINNAGILIAANTEANT
jgi:short-subunit dehydrogenase